MKNAELIRRRINFGIFLELQYFYSCVPSHTRNTFLLFGCVFRIPVLLNHFNDYPMIFSGFSLFLQYKCSRSKILDFMKYRENNTKLNFLRTLKACFFQNISQKALNSWLTTFAWVESLRDFRPKQRLSLNYTSVIYT